MTRDEATIKKDRLRYTKNKAAANLTYLAIVFNVLYFVNIYRSDVNEYYYTMTIGFSVVCNLLFLLVAFLSSEGVKNYKRNYAWALLVLSVVQVARICGIPRMAHSTITTVAGVERLVMENGQYTWAVSFLLISAVSSLAAGIVGLYKSYVLEKYEKDRLKKA